MRRSLLAVAALALVATSCGSALETGNYADETKPPKAATPTQTLPTCDAKVVTVSKDTATNLKVKPRVIVQAKGCTGVKDLFKKDLVVGKGEVVKPGDTVTAHYLGIGFTSRKQFDASWDRGEPTEFSLSGVIPGWTEAIPGMRIGGRRLLVIPGAKAYGDKSPSADILPNETLIFVVDITKTKAAAPQSGAPGAPGATPAAS